MTMQKCSFTVVKDIDQLTKIMQLVGKPSPEFLQKITSDSVSVEILFYDLKLNLKPILMFVSLMVIFLGVDNLGKVKQNREWSF